VEKKEYLSKKPDALFQEEAKAVATFKSSHYQNKTVL
jgi:hypothetical protein